MEAAAKPMMAEPDVSCWPTSSARDIRRQQDFGINDQEPRRDGNRSEMKLATTVCA